MTDHLQYDQKIMVKKQNLQYINFSGISVSYILSGKVDDIIYAQLYRVMWNLMRMESVLSIS